MRSTGTSVRQFDPPVVVTVLTANPPWARTRAASRPLPRCGASIVSVALGSLQACGLPAPGPPQPGYRQRSATKWARAPVLGAYPIEKQDPDSTELRPPLPSEQESWLAGHSSSVRPRQKTQQVRERIKPSAIQKTDSRMTKDHPSLGSSQLRTHMPRTCREKIARGLDSFC